MVENNELLRQIAELLEAQTQSIHVKIENDVTKRIDALLDGYKLTHEKQWELERRTEQLQSQLDDLQARIAALESKTA